MPLNENKQIESNFGTETNHLRQTMEQNMMTKEWMSTPITTKKSINNVNPDSRTVQTQQKDFSNSKQL